MKTVAGHREHINGTNRKYIIKIVAGTGVLCGGAGVVLALLVDRCHVTSTVSHALWCHAPCRVKTESLSFFHSSFNQKNCPRSRTEVGPTVLTRSPALNSASAATRRTPRRASSQPMTSQWKPTTTAVNQYSSRSRRSRSAYSRSTHLCLLTFDLSL